jgi:hypothetical protein
MSHLNIRLQGVSMNLGDLNMESILIDFSQESALLHKKRECTREALVEEVSLMKIACEGMDILNLRLGPYTKTVLAKIFICKEILEINGENLSSSIIARMKRILAEMEHTVKRKLEYGSKLDAFLEKKDNNIIEVIKSNLLESDLEQYAQIQKTLISFRVRLLELCDKLSHELY